MKRPTMLILALVKQFARDLNVSAERDLAVVQDRVEHEGLSFLTITLPGLSDALERGIETGRFTCPTSFKRSKHGRLPLFLGGFFNRVFDDGGCLLTKPDVEAIIALRQICRFFKKPKIACSPTREREAVSRFKSVEGELSQLAFEINSKKDNTLDKVSRIIWSQVLPEPDPYDLVCRHGPGVTAERYNANNRHRIRSWYTRSELLFPSALHAYPNYGWASEYTGVSGNWETGTLAVGKSSNRASEGLEYLDVGREPAVRVVFVPKTLKAPRVIAIEPSSMQFIQQSLMKYIVEKLEQHAMTKHSIRFRDQTVNQRLAHLSSIDRSLATLDLKDASDRVSLALVQRIFKGTGILEYLEDARSLHADLPDGSNLLLWKYASMGSALCFPVEAMVFYTIIQAAIHDRLGIDPSNASIKEITHMIDIYGDDIIIPVDCVDQVVRSLESYGLRVNLDKSFSNSHFRESCGGDYFAGTAVKPVYARELPPEIGQPWTPAQLMSWASTRNQLYIAGYWDVARAIEEMVEAGIRRRVPRSVNPGAGLAFHSLMFTTDLQFDRDTSGWKQRRLVFTPVRKEDDIDGDGIACLMRTLSTSARRERDNAQEPWLLTWATWDQKNSFDDGSSTDGFIFDREVINGNVLAATPWYGFLEGRSNPIDLRTSVKRGAFNMKHRWVKLAA